MEKPYGFYLLIHLAHLIKLRRLLLSCPISQMAFSYRITCSKIINQTMLPYISVPFVLYIPPQCNNPNIHTLQGSKKVANRVAVYQPKWGDIQLSLLPFLHRKHWYRFLPL